MESSLRNTTEAHRDFSDGEAIKNRCTDFLPRRVVSREEKRIRKKGGMLRARLCVILCAVPPLSARGVPRAARIPLSSLPPALPACPRVPAVPFSHDFRGSPWNLPKRFRSRAKTVRMHASGSAGEYARSSDSPPAGRFARSPARPPIKKKEKQERDEGRRKSRSGRERSLRKGERARSCREAIFDSAATRDRCN